MPHRCLPAARGSSCRAWRPCTVRLARRGNECPSSGRAPRRPSRACVSPYPRRWLIARQNRTCRRPEPILPNTGPNVPKTGPMLLRFGTNAPEFGTNAPEFGTNAPEFGTNAPEFGTNAPEFRTKAPEFRTNSSWIQDECFRRGDQRFRRRSQTFCAPRELRLKRHLWRRHPSLPVRSRRTLRSRRSYRVNPHGGS